MKFATQRVPDAPLLIQLPDTPLRELCRLMLLYPHSRSCASPQLRHQSRSSTIHHASASITSCNPPTTLCLPSISDVFPHCCETGTRVERRTVSSRAGISFHCRNCWVGATRPSERCEYRIDHRCELNVMWRNRFKPTRGRRQRARPRHPCMKDRKASQRLLFHGMDMVTAIVTGRNDKQEV
jgi:hypothetical protein